MSDVLYCRVGDSDSDSEDGEAEEQSSSSDNQADQPTKSEQPVVIGSDKPVEVMETEEDKGEIKITFIDVEEEEKEDPVQQQEVQEEEEKSPVEMEEDATPPAEQQATPTENDEEAAPPQETTPEETIPQEEQPAPPQKKLPPPDWKSFETQEALLTGLGGEVLKEVLSGLGLKCGGTPDMRAQRLFSVRNLSKEEIPAALFATSGKGRKRKVKHVEELVDR